MGNIYSMIWAVAKIGECEFTGHLPYRLARGHSCTKKPSKTGKAEHSQEIELTVSVLSQVDPIPRLIIS